MVDLILTTFEALSGLGTRLVLGIQRDLGGVGLPQKEGELSTMQHAIYDQTGH
jgi:hypothetical protein